MRPKSTDLFTDEPSVVNTERDLSLLDIGELAANLLDYDRKVAYFVLVHPQCGETWHVGEFDMSAVVVAIQD